MIIGSLFSGYGGLELGAAAALGISGPPAWTCDTDPAAARVLAYRFPDSPNLGDVTAVEWSSVAPVDVLTAGWPCQPFSSAGKRRGAADDRALWPFVAGAVRGLRPGVVVLENVSAVVAAGELGRATADLAALGYVGRWLCLRASDVGAPHRRDRCFIVARHPDRGGPEGWPTGRHQRQARPPARPAPDPDRDGQQVIGRGEGLEQRDPHRCTGQTWGRYAAAVVRWERLTRPAPPPLTTSSRGHAVISARFTEWMMGLPDGWVTGVPGVSNRQALKLCGNGVVPAQATAAVAALM